jgi:hypothetical protein
MKRIATTLVTIVGIMLGASIARAQNGHYITLSSSIDTNTACYDVTLKEAGLGNSGFSSVTYDLTADATFTAVCVNNGGNKVQGVPKTGSGSASSLTTCTIRNGSTNCIVSLCPTAFPLNTFPGCTDSQKIEITAASYNNVVLNDGLPSDVTAGAQGLPTLSASNLSVIVP